MQSYKNFREIEVLQEVRDWKLEARGYVNKKSVKICGQSVFVFLLPRICTNFHELLLASPKMVSAHYFNAML